MDLIFDIAASLIMVIAGLSILWLGFRRIQVNEVASRLDSYVTADNVFAPRWDRTQENPRFFSASFFTRVIVPRIQKIGSFIARRTPHGVLEALDRKLVIAGNPLRLTSRSFLVIRYALILLGFAGVFAVMSRGFTRENVLISAATLFIVWATPTLWLNYRMRARQEEIRRELPDALDMLSVLATAGLGFDQSLQHVSEHWDTHLGREFGRVITEISMGVTRAEALRNLVERVDIVELSTFVSVILQAEQIGMSISATLHSQADNMRMFRRFRAEEQIQKIPTKLLFPLAFLIFPAILAVVLGPSVPVLVNFFTSF